MTSECKPLSEPSGRPKHPDQTFILSEMGTNIFENCCQKYTKTDPNYKTIKGLISENMKSREHQLLWSKGLQHNVVSHVIRDFTN